MRRRWPLASSSTRAQHHLRKSSGAAGAIALDTMVRQFERIDRAIGALADMHEAAAPPKYFFEHAPCSRPCLLARVKSGVSSRRLGADVFRRRAGSSVCFNASDATQVTLPDPQRFGARPLGGRSAAPWRTNGPTRISSPRLLMHQPTTCCNRSGLLAVLAPSEQLRSSGPSRKDPFGTAACCESRCDVGRRCQPSGVAACRTSNSTVGP
jgi:hypothetical protein